MDWELSEELRRQLEREQGYCIYPAGTRERFAIVYPNSYYVGMSNLGLHIIYELLDNRNDTACERCFLPEKQSLQRYQRTNTPLMSLETQTPLFRFSIIGFALSFEMDYFNVLEILSLGHVKLLAKERGEQDPLVIAGGPCATFNPEPLWLFFDAFVIGEGEVILPQLLDTYYHAKRNQMPRTECLRQLAAVPGVYVPSLYEHHYEDTGVLSEIRALHGAPERVYRQWLKEPDEHPAHTVVITEDTEFNLYLIETARGCGRHCRFCMAGYCFRRPRNRSLEVLKREVEKAAPFGKRIGLMGAAISDHPEINALCAHILSKGLPMSVASFRADSVTRELVEALAESGLKTLTMAPEAGSSRMRAVINKGIEEEHIFRGVSLGTEAGIPNFRLYFMIGLPFEDESDTDAIVEMAMRVKDYMTEKGAKGKLTLSINPFIPKPFTPFQWLPMADKSYVEHTLKKIRKALKGRKQLEVIAESPREAYVQGILARGDRRLGEVLMTSWQNGGSKAFRRAMKEHGFDEDFYLYRTRQKDELFPWDVLDIRVKREYLFEELEKAKALQPTIQCFDKCRRCGVCDNI